MGTASQALAVKLHDPVPSSANSSNRRGRLSGKRQPSLLDDLNAEAVSAGLTTFALYAFAAVPLLIAVAAQLGLSGAQTASWLVIVWLTSAVSSIVLSLHYRQPIPITLSVPSLVYLGSLAGEFSLAELAAANLVAGLLILALALLGIGGRIVAWLPLPIVLAMFSGSMLRYVFGIVDATVNDVAIAGPTVVGYALGRVLATPRVPPIGLAALFGGVAIALAGRAGSASIAWTPPALEVPTMSLSLNAILAVSLPLVVLALAIGNASGLGFLKAQGYQVAANPISVVVGIASIVNAVLGGNQASVGRSSVATAGGPDAGPAQARYWASLIASSLSLLIAFGAGVIASLLGVLPASFIAAIAGLAILAAFRDALKKALTSELRFGALVAFVVAATPFAFGGITSAFWALIAGLAVSFFVGRVETLGSRNRPFYLPAHRMEPSGTAD